MDCLAQRDGAVSGRAAGMTTIDVNCFVGAYPYRNLAPHDAASLLGEMRRTNVDVAWISHLPAMYWRDPDQGNAALFAMRDAHPALRPVAALHPGLPHWQRTLDDAVRHAAVAIRCDPMCYGLDPADPQLLALASGCVEQQRPLLMAVRMEDIRQRHPNNHAGDLPAWAIRRLIRAVPELRMIVTHADRDFVEQVHWSLTPAESRRILWDICWLWGPPEDQLWTLLQTVGADRFTFGTAMPMRIPDVAVARIELLEGDETLRAKLRHGNLEQFLQLPS
jgi:predicted TIM-barrel fold metal-dependent hydrolase